MNEVNSAVWSFDHFYLPVPFRRFIYTGHNLCDLTKPKLCDRLTDTVASRYDIFYDPKCRLCFHREHHGCREHFSCDSRSIVVAVFWVSRSLEWQLSLTFLSGTFHYLKRHRPAYAIFVGMEDHTAQVSRRIRCNDKISLFVKEKWGWNLDC